ncbi:MAG: DUF5681 domain-containing protein [Rhodospirillales bacterium]
MADKAYDVGYGKPPKNTRFKPGQSGNSKGRPKGTRNLKTDLEEELKETITVSESGRSKRLSKQRALVKAMVAKALKGDARSTALLLGLIDKLISPDEPNAGDASLSPEDAKIIEAFLNSKLERLENDTVQPTASRGADLSEEA